MEEVFKIVWAGTSDGVPFGPILLGGDFYNEEDAKRSIKAFTKSRSMKDDEFNRNYFKVDKFYKFTK